MHFDEEAMIPHPEKLEQDWLYPSDTDYIFLGIFIPLAFTAMIALEGIGLLIDVFVFVACWSQLANGRIYYIVGGIKPRNFWIDRVLKGNIWEAEPARRVRARFRPAPPNRRLAINVVGRLALIYNKRAKTDTLLIGGSGSDNTSFDIYAQARIIERVGNSIKRIASVKNYEVIIGFLNMRRVSNVREMYEIYAEHIHPDFLPRGPDNPWPPEEDLTYEEIGDRNIASVMEDLLFVGRDDVRKNTMAVMITIRRDDLLRKAARKGGSMADLDEERLLIEEVAQVAEDELARCGVKDAHAFSLWETHEHLHDVCNVLQDDEYASMEAEVAGDEEHPDYDFFLKYFHWPKRWIRAFKNFCDLDGSHHAILRVVENPKTAHPMTFIPIFAIDNVPNVIVSVVGKTVKSKRTVRVMERSSRVEEVVMETLGAADDTMSAIDRRERHQEKITTAHRSRFTQLFNVVVVVSATNRRELEENVKNATRALLAVDGINVKRVKGSFLQVPWLLAAGGAPV